ncbi:TVP38/TMEM64 family protein [Tunicatimonas pelagia]|uniref:TVP38/TMEM64 family protein n=1 Tax=Tunicatimonas pelagia TaxID=931531 RepID=UPI0026650FDF|nr:VTT domain-containing protein [Tunicatimonas pelagia]WKN40463.1 VTT domain-containing protein [Tunicatimonas pelagia]
MISRSSYKLSSHRRTLALLGWMSIVPLLTSSIVSYQVIQHEATISAFSGEVWLTLGLVSCLAMGVALLPTSLMALLAGYFLGFSALPAVVIAYMLASLVGFHLTRWVDCDSLTNLLDKLPGRQALLAQQIQAGVVNNQLGLTALARMSPVMPFATMNVLLPVAGVSLRNYLLGGGLGMLPRTFFLIWLGSQAQEIRFLIKHDGDVTVHLFLAVMVMVTVIGTGYYAKRIFQQQIEGSTTQK